MKQPRKTPKQEQKSAEYDDAPSRATEFSSEAPGYDSRAPENPSYSVQDKLSDYAEFRAADRKANASNVQGEFAGQEPSDEQIKEEVLEMVAANADVDPTQLNIEVQDGTVKLTGAVTDAATRDWIDTSIETITGVKHIQDEIDVLTVPEEAARDIGRHALS